MDKSPDAFRTISEVADYLDTPAHVLRFWESRFPQIRPVKRAGGRRYYRPTDVALLGGIKRLLHDDGMTIRGVQKVLRDHGVRHVQALSGETLPDLPETPEPVTLAFAMPAEPAGAEIIPFAPPEPAGEPATAQDEAEAGPESASADIDTAIAHLMQEEAAEAPPAPETVAEATPEPEPEPEPAPAPEPEPEPLPAGTLPFTQPRATPAPPMPELPLFSPRATAPESPATMAELAVALAALPPGSLARHRPQVAELARRLLALLPADAM